MADTLLQITRQESIESRYSRKNIDGYIRDAIDGNTDTQERIAKGVELLQQWMSQSFYDSKKARLSQLEQLDLVELVTELFVGIAYVLQPQLFTSVTAQLAGRMGFDDKKDSIQTVAEVLAVLCLTDAFDITKADRFASLMLVSRLHLPPELIKYIEQSEYLPPMVCEPLELKGNYDSGYLGHRDSLILGNGNHHSGNICLDVLNKVNRVALKLDVDFLLSLEEEPTFELDDAQKRDLWLDFKRKSSEFYLLMHECGNEFYLTHKVDKRGRIYAQGYHINTQGTAYKKASIELSKQELVTGVPT